MRKIVLGIFMGVSLFASVESVDLFKSVSYWGSPPYPLKLNPELQKSKITTYALNYANKYKSATSTQYINNKKNHIFYISIGDYFKLKNIVAFRYENNNIHYLYTFKTKLTYGYHELSIFDKYIGIRKTSTTDDDIIDEKFDISFLDTNYIKKMNRKLSNPEYRNIKELSSLIREFENKISNTLSKKLFSRLVEVKKSKLIQLVKQKFAEAKKSNTIKSYLDFIKEYPNAPQAKEAFQKSYNISKSKNNLVALLDYFTKEVPTTNVANKANFLKDDYYRTVYSHTSKQNNISGYEWFIKTYPKAPQVKEAIKNIHKLAYDKAKEINTISAYNTFIYAYPFASQVKDANDRAYKLEEKEYTDIGMLGFFGKEEKLDRKGRELLNRAKIIERKGNEKRYDKKSGYILVANRMYSLLQDRFISSDATTRYLESQEFKDFVSTFKSVMRDISSKLTNIENYSSQIVEVSKQGFEDANANREMSRYKDEQHHQWEKRMRLRDKGNM